MSDNVAFVMLILTIAVIMFFIGAIVGESSKQKQWCRATNTELSKFEECIKREMP